MTPEFKGQLPGPEVHQAAKVGVFLFALKLEMHAIVGGLI